MGVIFSFLSVIIFGTLFLFTSLFGGGGLCDEKTEILSSSNTSNHEIVWWERDCGATTDFNTELILKNSSSSDEVVFLKGQGRPVIQVDWSSTTAKVKVMNLSEITEYSSKSLVDGFRVEPEDSLEKF